MLLRQGAALRAYPFLSSLVENWWIIRDEYLDVQNDTVIWPERHLHNGKWQAYGLVLRGRWLEHKCPKTAAFLKTVPGLFIAGFSTLLPGAEIIPHVGYTKAVLRSHLGLITPDGCSLSVGKEVYQWKAGELVVFDDTVVHSARNEGTETRVVLLTDFARQR